MGGERLEKRMMGIEELSEYIGLRPQNIRNRISSGTSPIPTKKIGRLLKWDRKDVDRYLDRLPNVN